MSVFIFVNMEFLLKVMLTSSFLALIFAAMPQAHFLNRNPKKTDIKQNPNKRFLLQNNQPQWKSWQQHVACQTTCVPGYEIQTRNCCMTGDNRLCFDLPWSLLNSSLGKCEDYYLTTPGSAASLNTSVSTTHPINHSDQPVHSTQDPIKPSELSTENSNLATKSSLSSLTHPDLSTTSLITDILSTVMTSPALPQSTLQSSVALVASTSTNGGLIVPTKSSTPKPTAPSYCRNKQSISCGFQFTIVCGSDGKYYANHNLDQIDDNGTLEPSNTTNMKILQTWFDGACSWAVKKMHITAHLAYMQPQYNLDPSLTMVCIWR